MKLVVISNRVPSPTAADQAGGLTVVLRDALSQVGGVWFGWNGTCASELPPFPSLERRDGIAFAMIPLTEYDVEHYYGGYANSVLWPLFHERLHAMEYRESFREAYRRVNAVFADHAAEIIEPDDVTWVHDYHLIPLGAELRQRGVTGSIGFFLHIPFPPFDVFRALPDHRTLLDSLLAYDLVGLQTPTDARHFADALIHAGAKVDLTKGEATFAHQRVRFGAFPVGIDVDEAARTALANRTSGTGQDLTRALRGRKLAIAADRLDYTKGLVQRLQGFETFLERHGNELDDQMIYVQIAAPSREGVRGYQALSQELEAAAGRISGRFNRIHWTPLRLIAQQVPRPTLLGYLSLAHVAVVTPLRDGMNLVAKEFLAAQTADDPGVLVLSSMAGAAEELGESAIVVNPYDRNEIADGMYRALTMPLQERRDRWLRGLDIMRRNTADIWRENFLRELVTADDNRRHAAPAASTSKAAAAA